MVSILETKKIIEIPLLENDDVMGLGISPDRQNLVIYLLKPIHVPTTIAGYPVQVIITGPIRAHGPRDMVRPLTGGISAGILNYATGTLGAIVIDRATGEPLLLSNNHVFADENNAPIGTPVTQPGSIDGSSEVIGTLARFIPWRDNDQLNLVDIALVSPSVDVLPGILRDDQVIPITGYAPLTRGEKIWKTGRTTGYSQGTVQDLDFTVDITTGENPDGSPKYIRFTDQILASIPALPGDSGSLIFDSRNRVVGLLFAGGIDPDGNSFIVANKIRNVLAMADVDIPVSAAPSAAPIIVLVASALALIFTL